MYWPEAGSLDYGPFTVELVAKEDEIDVVTRVFKLKNNSNVSSTMRLNTDGS